MFKMITAEDPHDLVSVAEYDLHTMFRLSGLLNYAELKAVFAYLSPDEHFRFTIVEKDRDYFLTGKHIRRCWERNAPGDLVVDAAMSRFTTTQVTALQNAISTGRLTNYEALQNQWREYLTLDSRRTMEEVRWIMAHNHDYFLFDLLPLKGNVNKVLTFLISDDGCLFVTDGKNACYLFNALTGSK